MRRFVVAALAAVAGLVAALVVATVPASAHAELIDSRPLPASTVGDVERLEFRFAGDIIDDEQTSITLELRRDPSVTVELGPPEVVTTSGYWFVEDPPQPWGELVVRGAPDDARVTVSGAAKSFELILSHGDDGGTIDISSLDPDAVSIIRIAQENIVPEAIEVELRNADGELAALSAVQAASSQLAADVIGDLPEAGDYIIRLITVAADEGLPQPNGLLFTYDPAAAPSPALQPITRSAEPSSSGSNGLIIGGVAAVVVAAVAVGWLARRRAARDLADPDETDDEEEGVHV